MSVHDVPSGQDAVLDIARRAGEFPGVIAVALGGSVATARGDACSDTDIYVYTPESPPLDLRIALAREYDPEPEIDNQAFGPGDEWGDRGAGLAIDLMYWNPAWIEEQIARVLDHHWPMVGYSTCFWRTVLHSEPLVDSTGWFAALQEKARQPYPEPLRQAIIANNWPLLRTARSSFLHQIECAIERNDPISVNHRTAALLASWFDVLFALNRVPHPGEKRLLAIARAECPLCPPDLESLVGDVIAAVPPPWHDGRLVPAIHTLIDSLERLVEGDGAM
jgi:hypothetical protein